MRRLVHSVMSFVLATAPLGLVGTVTGCGTGGEGGGGSTTTGPVVTVTCSAKRGDSVLVSGQVRKVSSVSVLRLGNGRVIKTVHLREETNEGGQGGAGGSGSIGPTTVDVNCPDDSGNTSPSPAA